VLPFIRHTVVMVLRKLLASVTRRKVNLVGERSYYRGFRNTLSIRLRTGRHGYLMSLF
jgi:hypothetical protein